MLHPFEEDFRKWMADPACLAEVLQLLAQIEVWADKPAGFPLSYPVYELDMAKGWFYLTPLGKAIYRENQAEVDRLKAIETEKLEVACKEAVQILLGPNPPTVIPFVRK